MTQTANTPTVSIRAKIAENLAGLAPTVEQRVIDTLIEKEVTQRADLISRGLDKLAEAQREHHKIDRPDNTTYNSDGSVATASYTKGRLDDLKKSNEQIEKFTRVLNKALEGELGDLKQLVNK